MKKIFFVSLGCDKNLVETECMLGLLNEEGYSITDDEKEADVIIINTCSFIHDAKTESIETILEMAENKKNGNCKALIVCGCLSQRYKDEIHALIPEIDALVGTTAFDYIIKCVDGCLNNSPKDYFEDVSRNCMPETKRMITGLSGYAYLKIAEGCDKHCTYCAIPKMRGQYRSVPKEVLLKQARDIAEDGYKEIILVAQETTLYGTDLYGKKSLPELVKEISTIEGIERIRILYCYPEEIDDAFIEMMKTNEKVCKYLDIPMQHASDSVLKLMGRRATNESLTALVERLRREVPGIVLRTSLITGFPGETYRDFAILKSFLKKVRLDRVGVFTYSKEEDTAASLLPHQVKECVKKHRKNSIMKLQKSISAEICADKIGKTFDVMVDGKLSGENVLVCRSYADAPGIDGNVYVECDRDFVSGTIIRAKVYNASEYDLFAEYVEETEKND